MEMAPASTRSSVSCPRSFSYSFRRAFPFACRALGAIRIHSSSRSSVLRLAVACFSSISRRFIFWSSHEE